MKILVLSLLVKFVLVSSKAIEQSDVFMSFVESFGYKAEAYEVETEDGYLLTLHRVLPAVERNGTVKNPVFLMHGLTATSGDYIVTGPKKALAFLLVDNGYDVWLGNARGNKYSTSHRNLSTLSKEYWNFSWHEIGIYDLPAMIDFMLEETKASKAFYVGHSQGTTSLFVLLSTRPEYNDKIIQAHLMSPVVFAEHFGFPLAKYLKAEIENGALNDYSYLNLDSFWDVTVKFRDSFCTQKQPLSGIYCPGLVFLFFFLLGANKQGIEMDTVSLSLKNEF
jgi:pimeloyl-ACP methyl ester carboxylesterase